MAVELIATEGAPNANTYATLEEADLYFDSRLNSDEWSKATVDTKKKALLMAAQILDTLNFDGVKYHNGRKGSNDYQSLQWPRTPTYNDPYLLGIPHLMYTTTRAEELWVDATGTPIVPEALKKAQIEEAYFLLRSIKGIDKREHIRTQGLDSISYTGVSENYTPRAPICPAAFRWLNTISAFSDSFRISRT